MQSIALNVWWIAAADVKVAKLNNTEKHKCDDLIECVSSFRSKIFQIMTLSTYIQSEIIASVRHISRTLLLQSQFKTMNFFLLSFGRLHIFVYLYSYSYLFIHSTIRVLQIPAKNEWERKTEEKNIDCCRYFHDFNDHSRQKDEKTRLQPKYTHTQKRQYKLNETICRKRMKKAIRFQQKKTTTTHCIELVHTWWNWNWRSM